MGVDAKTAGSYIDLLVDLPTARRLLPWHANVSQRLVKSPKVYVRASGLVHALLAIGDKDTLVSHPVLGASWEGFAIELALAAAPEGTGAHFYRTSAGAEIDRLLHLPGGEPWAIEIKRSVSPRPEKRFHHACADLSPGAWPTAGTWLHRRPAARKFGAKAGSGFGAGFFGEPGLRVGPPGESAPLNVIQTPAPKCLPFSGFASDFEKVVVGAPGFGPGTSCAQGRRSTYCK